MYHCMEEKIKYDDYGKIIRIENFLEDIPDKDEVPTKCVSTVQNF